MARGSGAGSLTEAEWERELEGALGRPIRVVYGRSRSSPLQMRGPTARELTREPGLRGGYVVRMHSLFAETPPEVREAIASWMRSGRRARRACATMSEWMHAALAELEPVPDVARAADPAGHHHHLEELARELLARWFREDFGPERPRPALGWGRRARSRSRHSLRLGSYEPSSHLVRVHSVLDQRAVPAWFVRYVLFHELLHAAAPLERDRAGRVLHHGPAFRRREALYPDFRRAVAWERAHVDALIRSARTGRPLRVPAKAAARSPRIGLRQLELFGGPGSPTR
jgi:hypothetical protein